MAKLVLGENGFQGDLGFGFNELGMVGWTLAPTSGTATAELRLARPGVSMVLDGAFTIGADGAVSGTLSDIKVFQDDRPVFTMTGLASQDVAPLLDYVLHQNYTVGLRDAIFAGKDTISGSDGADTIYAGPGDDLIDAGAGNDSIDAGPGNDTINGGDGIDSAYAGGFLSDFQIERDGTTFTLTNLKDGSVDVYASVEQIKFDSATYGGKYIDTTIDVNNTGGQIYRMYQAALGRVPDQLGLPFWTSHLGHDITLEQMAEAFTQTDEYRNLYGDGLSNHDLVARYYQNVLQRAPDEGGLAFWTGHLDAGDVTCAQVLAAISESAENVAHSAEVLAHGAVIEYHWPL